MQREHGEFNTIYMLAGDLDHKGDDPEDVIGTVSLEFADWRTRRKANAILGEIRERTRPARGNPGGDALPEGGAAGRQARRARAHLARSRRPGRGGGARGPRSSGNWTASRTSRTDGRFPGIEWEIGVDRTQAAKFGLDVATIGQFVQLVTRGLTISDYRPDDSDEESRSRESATRRRTGRSTSSTASGFPPPREGSRSGNFVERRARPRTGTLRRKSAAREITVRADVFARGAGPDDKVREIAGVDSTPRASIHGWSGPFAARTRNSSRRERSFPGRSGSRCS